MHIQGLEVSDDPVSITGITPGQLYVARRNTGWKLLTCQSYHPFTDLTSHEDARCGIVYPVENAYPFNDWECRLVLTP